MRLAAAVILYHPTEKVISNIRSYYDVVDEIFVYDNTEAKTPVQEGLLQLEKVVLIHDFENKGISIRLNDAANKAIERQYDWLLTMDQDSKFNQQEIINYINCFNEYKVKSNVAMFGPRYRDENISSAICNGEEVDALITSATLLNLQLFKTIGEFDEALFIDSVDHEYCVRAKLKGYSVIRFNNIYLHHVIGNVLSRASIKSLFLVKKQKEIHSPLRLYYMYRNMLYLENKYRDTDKAFAKLIRQYVITHIKVCLLYGRASLKIIRYLRAAYKDYKNMKMGKIDRQIK